MARRTANEIVQSLIEFYRIAQPNLDTSVGEVSRDVFIDNPAVELSKAYDELALVSSRQSFRLSVGQDVDNFLSNFQETKKKGTKSQVVALFTFESLEAELVLPKNGKIFAKNGLTYILLNSLSLTPVLLNTYQATAAKFKADLDFLGITDKYAVSVLAEATVVGSIGRISKYNLISTDIPGVSHVTNVYPAGVGLDPETDAQAKNRFFSILSGGSNGTALGYKNAMLEDPAVQDAEVIEPGDVLMTRDGTQVVTAEDGTKTIVIEGSGGKNDIIIFGSRLESVSDSFIYRDKSNTSDPTHPLNDWVLGQITGDENKAVFRRRKDNIDSGILPNQPVNNIVSVQGSSSGANFQLKQVDEFGRITGNYELVADVGDYAGSPWGFDKLHWISDHVANYPEDKTKNVFNGQEVLAFSNVTVINKVEQNIAITNENSKVDSKNRSLLQVKHSPCTAVTRVFNATTGERYTVTNQNVDGTTNINTSGKIMIAGKTLPALNEVLQVDYSWVLSYDPYFDFDNKLVSDPIRVTNDSLDWGYSNAIRKEQATLVISGSFVKATVSHPISSIASINTFVSENQQTILKSNRLAVVVTQEILNISSIQDVVTGVELWNTAKQDGTFKGMTIYFPTDSLVSIGQSVVVIYNLNDIWTDDSSFNNNEISIPGQSSLNGSLVECNYIANVSVLLPPTLLANLPAIRFENQFQVLSSKMGYEPCSFVFSNGEVVDDIRLSPSYLGLNILGNFNSFGSLTVSGQALTGLFDVVMTISANGLKQDLSSAIRTGLGVNSLTPISAYAVAMIAKFEKVTTYSTSSMEVISSDYTFNLLGLELKNNFLCKHRAKQNTALKLTEIILPSTSENVAENLRIGDKVRISFYVVNAQSETIFYSRPGIQYTKYKYVTVDLISIASGFLDTLAQNSTLTVTNLNQPNTKSRYRAYYNYTAPQTNERITVNYNFDKLIGDLTLSQAQSRYIGSDVLLKRAQAVLLDTIVAIVVTSEFEQQDSDLVRQNVQDAITNALRYKRSIIDANDLIDIAYNVAGVDRCRMIYFNRMGQTGSVLSVTPQKNEYFFPNTVTVKLEKR